MADSQSKSPPPARRAWAPAVVDPRGAAPLRIGEVLVGTQQYVAKQSGVLMTHDEWRLIVGAKIAARTRVGKLNRGTLTIKVASSAWSNELSFLRSQILSRLAQAGQEVSRLRFLVDQELFGAGPSSKGRQSKWLQSGRGPQPHRPSPARLPELPEELLERLRAIEDPNLRAAVAEAARVSLARSKGRE